MKLIQEAFRNFSCLEDFCEYLGRLLGNSRAAGVVEVYFMYAEPLTETINALCKGRDKEVSRLGGMNRSAGVS